MDDTDLDFDWQDAVELCDDILEMVEEIQERDDLPADADDYASSVGEKVESIKDWIDDHERVTDRQKTALENMQHGCERWLSGNEDEDY